jgi:Uma2 family endonuclease
MAMGSIDLIRQPLDRAALTARYEALLGDRQYRNLPGRLELNAWGQIIVTPPADFWHYRIAARLGRLLMAALGGESVQEGAVAIAGAGTVVADVVWCSPVFLAAHGGERVLQAAPEICVEVLSESSSAREIEEKRSAHLSAGAQEVWIVDPQGETIAVYGNDGPRAESAYNVDVHGLFAR